MSAAWETEGYAYSKTDGLTYSSTNGDLWTKTYARLKEFTDANTEALCVSTGDAIWDHRNSESHDV